MVENSVINYKGVEYEEQFNYLLSSYSLYDSQYFCINASEFGLL